MTNSWLQEVVQIVRDSVSQSVHTHFESVLNIVILKTLLVHEKKDDSADIFLALYVKMSQGEEDHFLDLAIRA